MLHYSSRHVTFASIRIVLRRSRVLTPDQSRMSILQADAGYKPQSTLFALNKPACGEEALNA